MAETILFQPQDIKARVVELADQLDFHLRGVENVIVIGVLKGAFMFTADLCRCMMTRHKVDFIAASSYVGKKRGPLAISFHPSLDLKGATVVLVDDICDSGHTLLALNNYLHGFGVAEVLTCVLLDKSCKREAAIHPDFFGWVIPDLFVYGYGMDVDGDYRDATGIAASTG